MLRVLQRHAARRKAGSNARRFVVDPVTFAAQQIDDRRFQSVRPLQDSVQALDIASKHGHVVTAPNNPATSLNLP